METSKTIWVSQTKYEVVDRLSSIDRGRFLVRSPNPRPGGTLFVAISMDRGPEADQFQRTISRIPLHISGIPKLQNHGLHDGKKILILDFLPGVTLADYFQKLQSQPDLRMSAYEVIRLAKGLVHGLRFMHETLCIVHGDIKPENIIVAARPAAFQLIDFGSAWTRFCGKTREEGDGFSECFGAPEMHGSGTIDHRSDQFSLGVILYLLLANKLPFEGVPVHELSKSDLAKSWSPPSNHSEDLRKIPQLLRDKIDAFVLKMLQTGSEDRFEMTSKVVTKLESILEDFRPAAFPSEKILKRNRWTSWIPSNLKTFLIDWLDRP